MKRLTLIAATLGLLALVPARATADLLVLNYSGSFSADTTLGGTPLGTETPFTFAATFDSTADQEPGVGGGLFPATVVFDIAGFGTFTVAPEADMSVELFGPPFFDYQLRLLSGGFFLFNAVFSTASPPLDPDSPSPTVLSGFFSGVNFNFILPLAGGAGDLFVPNNGSISFGQTATITASAVPEPSSFTLLGFAVIGSAGLAAARRRASVRAGRQVDSL